MANADRDAIAVAKHPGWRLALYSLALNLLLTLVKFLLYLLTGSAALLAETVHSLTDVVGISLVLGGLHLSAKKSAQFPWGLYKAENLAALLSAGLILLSAYEIARMLIHPAPAIKHLDITLAALLTMALPIVAFSRYERRKALELNSPSLQADAENWRTDLAPLAIVAAGLVGARFSSPYFDRIAAFIILLLVLKAGYGIARDAVRSLLDASADRKTLEDMADIIRSFHEVAEVVSLKARNSGRYIFAETEVRVTLKRLKEAHVLADRIEDKIRQHLPFVEKVSVHYEPEARQFFKHAAPLANRDGTISDHFGAAPMLAFWTTQAATGSLVSREISDNPFATVDKGKGIRLAEFLVGRKIDFLYTREDFAGKGPAYVLADAGIDVRSVDVTTLDELLISTGEVCRGDV
jgi:cation diffusion facilitator family transporter